MTLREALRLAPAYQERVWGGQRLQPGPNPIGEAWIVHEGNSIVGGTCDGRTLAELAATQGEALLGRKVIAQGGARFPLLIKILDAHDWLSVQVHPNDEQAIELAGPGQLGKTEAWHILAADPGAQLICGLQPGTTNDALAAAIRAGTVTDLARYLQVAAGDTIFIAAGTMHALGPGLLLYEVQQTSDITYRIFDWNRPLAAGRKLHIEESLAVTNPAISGEVQPRPVGQPGTPQPLVACPYFALSEIVGPASLDTGGESFHALTPVAGEITVAGDGWQHHLAPYESIVVPASAGAYSLTGDATARSLLARVP
jgi:mannose-6-phosphate isomerase